LRFNPEDAGATLLRNIKNYMPSDSASALPLEPQMLYHQPLSEKYDVFNIAKIFDPTG
jgi:hypothetical protein